MTHNFLFKINFLVKMCNFAYLGADNATAAVKVVAIDALVGWADALALHTGCTARERRRNTETNISKINQSKGRIKILAWSRKWEWLFDDIELAGAIEAHQQTNRQIALPLNSMTWYSYRTL